MRTLLFALCALCVTITVHAQEPTFRWTLPTTADAAKLTQDKFPDADALILAKEEGFMEGPHTRSIFMIYNEVTISTKALMVKLFNQRAVEIFGSFTYEFPDRPMKEEKHTFRIAVRVMKPDGTVHVLPDTAIKTVTGIATGRGRALTQKVMYKLPDLAPGDIVHYEYSHAEPFSNKRQVLFYHHDRYPVLTSMAYINMPKQENVEYVHFPPEQFGPATVKDEGKSISSSWTLKGLAAVPDEPYGRPLADVTYLTTIVNKPESDESDGWREVAQRYFSTEVKKGSVSGSFMEELGVPRSLGDASWGQIDSLYSALRKYFRLKERSSVFTAASQMDKQIEEKEGDATDVAFIMLKALERWNVNAVPVLIRDRRAGSYELTVPSLVWFNRMALLISHKGKDLIYDFDRCVPSRYESPWFLNPITMFAVEDTGGAHLQLRYNSSWREHISSEMHLITLKPGKKAADSVVIALKGALAQSTRGAWYASEGEELDGKVRSYLEENVLDASTTVTVNAFRDEPVIIMNGTGTSRGAITAIDTVLLFQPQNQLLRHFRSEFSLPKRHFDVFLPQMFAYSLSWEIAVPTGYHAGPLPAEKQIVGPSGATAQISCMQQEDRVMVKGIVVFAQQTIPLEKYAEWKAFLDNVNAALEREVSFVKTGTGR